MLKSLSVKDFAIIEDLHINFYENMTVLTGETGAGKSLIIDTISLLLGQRADSEMIRYGKSKAIIEGIFSYKNNKIYSLLEKYGIKKDEDLTIYREILDNGRNVIKINNVNATLAMLKSISMYLADIHNQNDTFKLFNQESYLFLISPSLDEKYVKLLSTYTLDYSKYLEEYKKYEHILKGQKQSIEKLEFLKYEKDELEKLNLEKNLDESLSLEIAKLSNYDMIYSSLASAYEQLDNEALNIDYIYNSASSLKKIVDIDNIYSEFNEKLIDCYYTIDEIKNQISKQIQSLDFDQDDLNYKMERLNEIEKAKKKYNLDLDGLISHLERITTEIEMVDNYDFVLSQAKENVIRTFENVKKSAIFLSDYRKNLALKIEKGIIKECLDLDLEDIQFKVAFNELSLEDPFAYQLFKEDGIDEVDFKISFNKGEPLRSLNKVASGGEMSRIMLAFKSYFSLMSNYSLMVFDEIDTGVSGSTAKKIANKLSLIAKNSQVLCITHLPQVASIADSHIHIYKEVSNNRTTTHFKYLSFEERVEEIALMLSGDKISLYALEHAKSLLTKN